MIHTALTDVSRARTECARDTALGLQLWQNLLLVFGEQVFAFSVIPIVLYESYKKFSTRARRRKMGFSGARFETPWVSKSAFGRPRTAKSTILTPRRMSLEQEFQGTSVPLAFPPGMCYNTFGGDRVAYSELIKNFGRVRDYMREFYVYGFKRRDEYEQKSARSYDNERRRIESYLGDYMGFRQTTAGKNVFLSIDSRGVGRNPLYRAFKAKSFTNGDITLHFILFDILDKPETALPLKEIVGQIGEYLLRFGPQLDPTDAGYEEELARTGPQMVFDESTVRKKLKEYADLGLIEIIKNGRSQLYRRAQDLDISACRDALEFFSEAGLCGVAGSFLLDKLPPEETVFSYKHHYITHVLESEVLCALLDAITARREAELELRGEERFSVVPLKIFVSVQGGRRYLMAYDSRIDDIRPFRLDFIARAKAGAPARDFDAHIVRLNERQKHMWGVTYKRHGPLEHVEFTIEVGEGEEYIARRLEREKRCGTVERIDEHTLRFSADVYDTNEMTPWIRSFICRITSIRLDNQRIAARLHDDLQAMYRLYGLEDEQ